MVMGVLGQQVYAKDLTIRDMSPADPAYSTVQWVVDQGCMSLTLGRFYPGKFVKRSEFAAIVTKMSGRGSNLQNPKMPSFQDVTDQNQFYKQIETTKNYFVAYKSNTGKLFKPNSYLTREDAMMAIIKVLGYDSDAAVGSNDNTDVSIEDIIDDAGNVNPALMKYVAIGVSNELMDLRYTSDKTFFDPKRNITRRDLALLIYNAYQKKDYNAGENDDSDQNPGDTGEDENGSPSDEGAVALPQVGQLAWEFTKISWSPVENAANYELKLYKGESVIDTETAASGTNSFDFIKLIAADPLAAYKVTVQAKGTGSFTDGAVSKPAIKVFSLQEFRIKDGEGITFTPDPATQLNTISLDGARLPARLPGTFNVCLIRTDIVSDGSILSMVTYYKQNRIVAFTYNGRSGEYYRYSDENRAYSLLLLFDTDMNFLGYYTFQNQ